MVVCPPGSEGTLIHMDANSEATAQPRQHERSLDRITRSVGRYPDRGGCTSIRRALSQPSGLGIPIRRALPQPGALAIPIRRLLPRSGRLATPIRCPLLENAGEVSCLWLSNKSRACNQILLFNSKYHVQIDQPLLPGDINPRTRSVCESVGLVHQAAIPFVLPIGLDSIRILRIIGIIVIITMNLT